MNVNIAALRAETEARHQKSETNQKPVQSNFVLYVWGEDEKCSSQALDTAVTTGAIDVVTVVDARTLPLGEIPDWLSGVPTLLVVEDKEVFRGKQCLYELQNIGENKHLYTTTVKDVKPPASFQMPRMRQMPPQIPPADDTAPPEMPSFTEPIREKKADAQSLKNEIENIMAKRDAMLSQPSEEEST